MESECIMTSAKFRAARQKLGSQREVAAMLGVSRRTLQGWEAGDAPKVSCLAIRWLVVYGDRP